MLNAEKIELMSRVKVIEEGKNKDTLLNKSYFEGKNAKRVFTSTLFGVFSYVILLCIAYLLFGNSILDFTQKTALSVIIAVIAVLVGVAFVIIYVKCVKAVLSRRYENKRSAMVRYDILKEKLASLRDNRS